MKRHDKITNVCLKNHGPFRGRISKKKAPLMLKPVLRAASLVAIAGFAAPAWAQAPADTPYGTWIAADIDGQSVAGDARPVLELASDNAATGTGGCNRFRGTFESTADTISFGPSASTRMACAPAVLDQEQRFHNALENARNWKRDDAGLTLLGSDGKVLARFTAQSPSAAITIDVPDARSVERNKVAYDCAGTPVNVEYINAGGTSLATLSLNGQFVVASNVISASGARYAGGPYVWWSKGDSADFYDLMKDADKPVSCTSAEAKKPAGN